jgi:hypothetical protein
VLGADGVWHVSPEPGITVGEHIRATLAGSRAGRRNDAAVRESARVLQSHR